MVGREWVELIELATCRVPNPWRWRDIFYSRSQREADAFHLRNDKFLELSVFFIYITYSAQCSLVPPNCTQILWNKHLPPCAFLLWQQCCWEKEGAPTWQWHNVISKLSNSLSTKGWHSEQQSGKVRVKQPEEHVRVDFCPSEIMSKSFCPPNYYLLS